MFQLVPALLCVALAAPPGQSPVNAATTNAATRDAVEAPVAAASAPVPAPSDHIGFRSLLRDLKGDVRNLPSTTNLYVALAGGALALGVHPFDVDVNARLMNHYDGVNTFFTPGKYYGDTPEQVAFSVSTYLLGRVLDKPRMAHLGMDLLRAQAITEMLVEPLKFSVRRERPDGSNRQSFPSGHAAITFAAASVIERHLGWKASLAAYAIASYVAASRLHDNVHYLSDVVFGAAVGTIAGRTVTVHGRDHWALGPTAVNRGVAIVAARIP